MKKERLVKFTLNSKMPMCKKRVPLNKVNKQEFPRHLTEYMNCNDVKSVQSYADADILIATTTVSKDTRLRFNVETMSCVYWDRTESL